MAEWIELESEPFLYQPHQIKMLQDRRERTCRDCKIEFNTGEHPVCPQCGKKGVRKWDRMTIIAGRRFGKAASVDTPVLTTQGWKPMLDVGVGDYVFTEDGEPTEVVAATEPWFSGKCYRITFSDGATLVVDGEHEWVVHDKPYRKSLGRRQSKHTHWAQSTTGPRTVTTSDMLIEGLTTKDESRFAVPTTLPVKFPAKTLLIDPYVLGVWLGDGHSRDAVITSDDPEIPLECANRGYTVRKLKSKFNYSIDTKVPNPLGVKLKCLNLIKNKHIPRAYLEASVEQRLDLLRGLMDTDGHIDKGGHCEFTNTNKVLTEQVMELLVGLGEKPTFHTGKATLNGKYVGPKYRIFFTPKNSVFLLSRKQARQKIGHVTWLDYRYIKSIERVEDTFVKCIQVSSPSSQYLLGTSCIPTHNSRIGSIMGVEEASVPNSVGWACAPTNPKLHRYVIPAFQKLIPNEWVKNYNSEFKDLWLKNGALIHFQTLEDPDQGRGQGLDWLWIDEVCELSPAHWEVIRPSLAGDTVAFFTTSPRGYDWVHDELYKPALDGVPGYWACLAKTQESANPRISAEFLERERLGMSDTMYRQEYEADFVVFQGAIYGDLIDSQILHHDEAVRKFIPEWPNIDPSRTVLIGLDTGADHPFGATKTVVTEKGLVVVGEYLERHRSFLEHATEIKRMAGNAIVKYAINKNERQPMIELAQAPNHIYCTPAQNDQISGIERVKVWLHNNQMWFVASRVPRTIQQMKSYRYADNTATDGSKRKEQVYKKDDELPDTLRYSVMIWPQLPQPPEVGPIERDLSNFTPEQRWATEKIRRIDKEASREPETVSDEFWISSL